ncbi:MAG: hypothetical protein HGA45_40120, partial [Chloroflexales bacterium]|nr:hypothetical protein [Chloroflexales bacterium]
GLGPWLGAAAMALLLARTLVGLRPGARATRALAVGMQEAALGLLTALMIGLGMS